jgi:tetratricopeptide (TPR) repeat protein
VALFVYWEPRELLDEARQRLQRVTSLAPERGSEPLRARAISYLAALADLRGDHDEACRLHEQALAAFRNISDRKGELSQLNSLGAHYTHVGQYDSARSYWEQTLALCRESGQDAEVAAVLSNLAGTLIRMHEGDRARSLLEDARAVFERIDDQAAVLWSVNRLGDVEREAGELHGAKRRYQEALDGFVRLGDPWGVARTAADLGEVQTELGECAPARQSLKTALSTFLALDHKRGIARALEGISLLALREGQPRRALTLAGAAAGVRVAFGAVPRPPDQADFEQRLSPARSGLPASEAQAAWDAGAHLTLQDSIQVALASAATGRAAQAAARQDS